MRSVSVVGVRSVRRSFSRYVLTALGAALGVAVMFGVLATNASIDAGLNRALGAERVPTVSIEPIGSYGNVLPAATVEQIAKLPDVGFASGGVFISGRVAGADKELNVYGTRRVDGPARGAASDRWQRSDFGNVEGRLPAEGADEVSLARHRAEDLGVGLGDTVELTTRTGVARLTVVRLVDFPDQSGLVSLSTAQRLLGRGDVVQNVHVQLADGVQTSAWVARHASALGPNVRATGGGGDAARGAVSVIQAGFSALGLMASFVGGFLIYLTLSTSVAERTRTWGVLRAVGGNRSDIVRAVLAEAVALAVVATALGLVIGSALGTLLLRFSMRLYELPPMGLTITGRTLLAAVALGLLTPPLAGLLPAWRAAKAEPVDAMRERHVDPSRLGRAWIVGVVFLVVATVVNRTGGVERGLGIVPVVFLLGAVLVIPLVLGPVARVVGKASARLSPGLGGAAVNHLVKERQRSAYTLGLVMVVLAMVLALAGVQVSITRAMEEGFRIRYAADVGVWAWDGMAPEVADALRKVEGVDASTEYRSGRVGIAAPTVEQAELLVIEPRSFFAMQGLPWSDGDDDVAEAALAQGGAVLVPEVYALRAGIARGERLSLTTTEGARDFEVAGVYSTPEPGFRVIVGLVDGQRWFAAGTPQGLELRAAEGVTPAQLVERAKAAVGDRPGYFVNTMAGEQRATAERLQNYFRPFLAVILVAGVVGALGLANTLAIGVLRRTREIGVLRAVGIDRSDLRRMVLVEALTMGAVAFVLSLPLGWVLESAILEGASGRMGFVVDLAAPWATLPVLAVAVVCICGAAAVGPARRIARLDPVAALRFE